VGVSTWLWARKRIAAHAKWSPYAVTVNPGYLRGITIGSANDGSLKAFIPDPDLAQADVNRISGASGIVADGQGTIYAADVGPHRLRKYVLK